MLAVWKDWGLVNILKKAYEKGTIMCGVSAGAICWFEYGITDSWEDELKIINCLGFVPGCCCPHYDEEPEREPSLRKFLNEGTIENCIAIDGGCALHIKDGVEKKAIAFAKKKNAYLVKKNDEVILKSPYLREKIFLLNNVKEKKERNNYSRFRYQTYSIRMESYIYICTRRMLSLNLVVNNK